MVSNSKRKNSDKSELVKRQLLSEMSGMIISPTYRKELIDLINKYIEHNYNDVINRLPYTVSNINLAHFLNTFISINNSSFNKDLSNLTQRFLKQNYSSADGSLYSTYASDPEKINSAIDSISQESKTEAGEKKSEDDIKLALINKGIKKKKLMGSNIFFILFIIALAIGIIYLLMRLNKGKERTSLVGGSGGGGEPGGDPGPSGGDPGGAPEGGAGEEIGDLNLTD